jgi:protein-disulfide isomerase
MRRRALALVLLAAAACRDAAPETDPVIARLGGEPIRRSEVSAPAAFRLYLHEAQSYALLEEETGRLVDERLLAEAARAEDIAPEALLARVEADGPAVTDADVERYLAAHPGRAASGTPEAVRARVRLHLEERNRAERRLRFLAGLREREGFEWLLEKPVAPRVAIDAGRAPARGPTDAPVTIVHLASFGSADSARSAAKLARLVSELPGRVRWLHVNLLGERDEGGLRAAQLGFLAQDAGRFWEAHDALFEQAGRLDPDALAAAGRAAGLAEDALARADEAALLRRVEADDALARRSGALREPTLFVNGRYWSGLGPYPALLRIVKEELGEPVEAPLPRR